MGYSSSEKMEAIRVVEDSELSIRQTLKELSIHRSIFYNWYRQYLEDGEEGWGQKTQSQNLLEQDSGGNQRAGCL
jgi:putative transposase